MSDWASSTRPTRRRCSARCVRQLLFSSAAVAMRRSLHLARYRSPARPTAGSTAPTAPRRPASPEASTAGCSSGPADTVSPLFSSNGSTLARTGSTLTLPSNTATGGGAATHADQELGALYRGVYELRADLELAREARDEVTGPAGASLAARLWKNSTIVSSSSNADGECGVLIQPYELLRQDDQRGAAAGPGMDQVALTQRRIQPRDCTPIRPARPLYFDAALHRHDATRRWERRPMSFRPPILQPLLRKAVRAPGSGTPAPDVST